MIIGDYAACFVGSYSPRKTSSGANAIDGRRRLPGWGGGATLTSCCNRTSRRPRPKIICLTGE